MAKSEYKPLLFTTTVRNPQRLKALLWVFKKFNGLILTDALATQIVREVIKYGLYRPMKITPEIRQKWATTPKGEFADWILSDKELNFIMQNNPQKHKEAGFSEGFPSRFATIFDFTKELGLVYYQPNEEIHFSELGLLFASIYSVTEDGGMIIAQEEHPEYEQQVFLQSMCKYQRCNPFIRVLNENVPLILLLQTIQKLNSDPMFNGAGIARHELPLLIFWKDGDAEALYRRIKQLRQENRYNPSDEVIIDICTQEIMGGFKKFKDSSIMSEYPDEFIRKMRLTGLISLRGAGRFIDVNHNEDEKIKYVLSKYSQYEKYATEREYFDYMASIDENLISIQSATVTETQSEEMLQRWVDVYSWDCIKKELLNLAERRSSSDDILRFLPNPVRLEFLTALAIKSCIPESRVIPNYPCDDEGLPTSTAGGNKGDIECLEPQNKCTLVEVTMAEGRTQTMMEVWPISRHYDDFSNNYVGYNAQCVFIAPTIFSDSISQILWCKDVKNQVIRPYKIADFIDYLDNSKTLYE